MSGFSALVGSILALLTLPGTLELILLTVGGILPMKRPKAKPSSIKKGPFRMAAIIPAHNEELSIERTVRSLLACDTTGVRLDIVVVADNCTDETAAHARRAKARVLVRHNLKKRGKQYALDYAFQSLVKESFEAFVLVDADTEVQPNFVTVFKDLIVSGAAAVQCRNIVLNLEASIRTRLMNTALMAFNVLRPRGRDRWGFSAGCLGNGFGLALRTLKAVPWALASVALPVAGEDLEYHLQLTRAGYRVRFADQTTVRADIPPGEKEARVQRIRWEGGRFRMALNYTPSLIKGICRGQWILLEPLLDLLLLPLSYHVTLLLMTLIPPYVPTQLYACFGLLIVGMHVVAGIIVGGGGLAEILSLIAVPFYMAWKISLSGTISRMLRKNVPCIRTERSVPK